MIGETYNPGDAVEFHGTPAVVVGDDPTWKGNVVIRSLGSPLFRDLHLISVYSLSDSLKIRVKPNPRDARTALIADLVVGWMNQECSHFEVYSPLLHALVIDAVVLTDPEYGSV